jgi:uncharacterized protein
MTKNLYQVRNSPVHGKGVFAKTNIKKGTRIIEYRGEFITNDEADKRWPTNPDDPFHTFFFSLDTATDYTIDANVKGNAARWINHHCQPNCETEELVDSNGAIHVYIDARRDINAGDELNYDYRLQLDGKVTKKDKKNYLCLCGAKKCRGTMLLLKKN